MPVCWPDGLWYRKHTQNGDAHISVTDTYLQFRVHIDEFHGDRPLTTPPLTSFAPLSRPT